MGDCESPAHVRRNLRNGHGSIAMSPDVERMARGSRLTACRLHVFKRTMALTCLPASQDFAHGTADCNTRDVTCAVSTVIWTSVGAPRQHGNPRMIRGIGDAIIACCAGIETLSLP